MRTSCLTTDRIAATVLLFLYVGFTVSMMYNAPPTTISDTEVLNKLNQNGRWVYSFLFGIMCVLFLWVATKIFDLYVKIIVAIGEQISLLFCYYKATGTSLFEFDLYHLGIFLFTVALAIIGVFHIQKIELAITKKINNLFKI